MSSSRGKSTHIVARIRTLFHSDWIGRPGKQFRETTQAISDFADEHHIASAELLSDGVKVGRRKPEGLASHEYAEVLTKFAEEERVRLQTEMRRRSMDAVLKKQTAEARRSEAEARSADISAVKGEIELVLKLRDARIALHRDPQGNLTALPAATRFRLGEFLDRKALIRHANVTEEFDGVHVHGEAVGPISFPGKLLIVEPGARVLGNLHADVIQILPDAEVLGDVHGTKHVEIKRDGRVIGDVETARISIEDEGLLRGAIDITKPVQ